MYIISFAIYDHYESKRPAPFIWRFSGSLNALHDWPGKYAAVTNDGDQP